MAIEGILLPLTVPNEFHEKCIPCVSANFESGASGSGSLSVVTATHTLTFTVEIPWYDCLDAVVLTEGRF